MSEPTDVALPETDMIREALAELAEVNKRRLAKKAYGRAELHLHYKAGILEHWAIVEVTSVK